MSSGVRAALGRPFGRAADAGTAEPLVVLSDDTWRHQFAADPTVVNTRVRINGVPHTVVGVMPAGAGYPEEAQAWVLSSKPVPVPPIDVAGDLLASRGVHYIKAIGRLLPGVNVEQGQQDLAAIAAQQASHFAESNSGRGIALRRLRDEIVGDVRAPLLLLLGAVGLVLLIACANVASLLLARAASRQREIAIRAALGARRTRLLRQLITESLVLGAAGGAGGLLVGTWALTLLLKVMPQGIPRVQQISLDLRVAIVAIAASLATAVLFGLVPALQASRTDGVTRTARFGSGHHRRTGTGPGASRAGRCGDCTDARSPRLGGTPCQQLPQTAERRPGVPRRPRHPCNAPAATSRIPGRQAPGRVLPARPRGHRAEAASRVGRHPVSVAAQWRECERHLRGRRPRDRPPVPKSRLPRSGRSRRITSARLAFP